MIPSQGLGAGWGARSQLCLGYVWIPNRVPECSTLSMVMTYQGRIITYMPVINGNML